MRLKYELIYKESGAPFYLVKEVGMSPTMEQVRGAESNNGVIDAPDFETAKELLAEKFNLGIYIDGDGKVLLSCGRFRVIAVLEEVRK